jgi:hypothetical protein
MVQITPAIQKVIDASNSMDKVVSLQVTDVPQYLIDRVGSNEVTYFDYIIKTEDGTQAEVAFVVPNSIIDDDTHKMLAIKDLVSCSRTITEDANSIGVGVQFSVGNKFTNTGKTIYYIRPDDQYLVRLNNAQPKILTPTDTQQSLINILKTIPGVIDIHIEEIIDDEIKSDVKSENAVMIVCTTTINGNTGQLHFALPDTIYNNPETFEHTANNLIQLLSQ